MISNHLHHEFDLFTSRSQISVEFADLHDTPGRMQEKGVISVSSF